jgi:type II secretory ATPase GspE/PulE/Tfp pilus assembly ATPase PilB-like protein
MLWSKPKRRAAPAVSTSKLKTDVNGYPVLWDNLSEWCYLDPNGILYVDSTKDGDPFLDSFMRLVQRQVELEACKPIRRETRDLDWIIAKQQETGPANEGSESSEVIGAAQKLFRDGVKERASDIHLVTGQRTAEIKFRVDGNLTRHRVIQEDYAMRLCRAIYGSMADVADRQLYPTRRQDARIAQRGHLPVGVHGVRIATTPTDAGYMMILRLLYEDIQQSDEEVNIYKMLGYADRHIADLEAMMDCPHGINVIAGITGSGKSTTLKYTIERLLKEKPELHALTVEDPPEYPIAGANQVPVIATGDEERTRAFVDALRAAMRLDPDIIMVGEIRDFAGADTAINAAMTGHQVWTTIHADDAIMVLSRLTGMGVDADRMTDASVLTGLVSQRLVRTLCPECSESLILKRPPAGFPAGVVKRLQAIAKRPGAPKLNMRITGPGCEHCKGGVTGRSVVAETIATTQELLGTMRQEGVAAARQYWLNKMGGLTLVAHAAEKVFEGAVDPRDAERIVGRLEGHGLTGLWEKRHATKVAVVNDLGGET